MVDVILRSNDETHSDGQMGVIAKWEGLALKTDSANNSTSCGDNTRLHFFILAKQSQIAIESNSANRFCASARLFNGR